MVKQLLCPIALVLLCAQTAPAATAPMAPIDRRATVVESSSQRLTISFDLSGVPTPQPIGASQGSAASIIPAPTEFGLGRTLEEGKPILPRVSRFVVVPPDRGLELVVSADEPRAIPVEGAPPIYFADSLGGDAGAESAQLDGLYPAQYAEMTAPIVIRGVRLVQITTYPIQYDPVNQQYLRRDHIQAEVRFTDAAPENPAEHPIRAHRSKNFLNYINALAMNGADVGRDDPDHNEASPYAGHYLVVIHESCLEYARPFIEWRRRAGYKMDIVSLNNQDATSAGTVVGRIQAVYNAYLDAGEDPFDEIILIGDRASYGGGQGPQSILEAPVGQSEWGQPPHADYFYGDLEGRDNYADVGVSRWPTGSRATMELVVGKTLSYESAPFLENPAWFSRAVTFSQHDGHQQDFYWKSYMPSTVNWAREVVTRAGVDDVTAYEDYAYDQNGDRVGPWLAERYNEGQNVIVGIGGNYYWRQNFTGVERNTVFPIQFSVGCHTNWMSDVQYRTGAGNDLKGPVAITSYWGDPSNIVQMTAVWMETVSGMFTHDLPLGWSRVFAASAVDLYYSRATPHIKSDYDCYGDPGLQPWLGEPRAMAVALPDSIAPDAKYVEVSVRTADDDTPVEGAQVTFYAPGNLPGNINAYAAYNGMYSMIRSTDADGMARFILENEGDLEGNAAYVTVTGREVYPNLQQIEISGAQPSIGLGGYELTEIEGNGDDAINPGETFAITLTALNADRAGPIHDVIGMVSSASPWVTVSEEEVTFGDMRAGESAVSNEEAVLQFSPVCPDASSRPSQKPSILIAFTSAEYASHSGVTLEPVAPNYETSEVVGGSIIGTEQTRLDIELKNIGSVRGGAITARLQPLRGRDVQVIANESSYNAIDAGGRARLSGDPFVVAGTRLAVPGAKTEMLLILSSEGGFVDSAYFVLQVGEPRANAPQGPDAYGYVCFDDRDRNWESAPEYNWIEICPAAEDADYEGTAIEFEADELQIGRASVLDLDFNLKFYGEEYDQVTVSSNGFISMGSQPRALGYENWPMDRAIGGGVGMIAPFWDDLDIGFNDAGVYYYYDAEHGTIIIEWRNVRLRTGAQRDNTFEVVLYDSRVWETETGDAMILFQYRHIENSPNLRDNENHNNAFASIGISSPEGTGINYSWRNISPVTSAAIEDWRAILFATSAYTYNSGVVHGVVSDFETRQGIAGALVSTSYGFLARSNDAGEYFLADALADYPFRLTVSAPGYLDSTISDTSVRTGGELELNFFLLHPEFTPSEDQISADLDPGMSRIIPLEITNTGNGVLTWSAEKRLLGEANAAPWATRQSLPVGATVGDDRLQGVVFLDNRMYVSGANGADSSLIYVLDREGALWDTFYQAGHSRYGFRDLETDGELIWAAGEDSIYGFTTEGEVIHRWRSPTNPSACIAWDGDREMLLVSGITTNIFKYDSEGNLLDGTLNRRGLRIYGLAYWQDDPDNSLLYLLTQPAEDNCLMYKMNIDTGDTVFVQRLELPPEEHSMSGASITNGWDVYSWVMLSVDNLTLNRGGDRIRILQVDARKDWFNLDVFNGVLPPDGAQELELTLDATNLPDTLFEGELYFSHNAPGGSTAIRVSLRVLSEEPPGPFALYAPANGDSISAYHFPGDSMVAPPIRFIWQKSEDPNLSDTLVHYIYHIRAGDVTRAMLVNDTTLSLKVDTLGLPVWLDQPITWWVDATSGGDITECQRRFVLTVSSNSADEQRPDQPVEFGLQSIYPSPFNSVATVRFGADRATRTTLRVYDALGREMAVLYEGVPAAGVYKVEWDAGALASGVYIIRLESASRVSAGKAALVR